MSPSKVATVFQRPPNCSEIPKVEQPQPTSPQNGIAKSEKPPKLTLRIQPRNSMEF